MDAVDAFQDKLKVTLASIEVNSEMPVRSFEEGYFRSPRKILKLLRTIKLVDPLLT